MGGRPGSAEGGCSAGVGGGETGVCAASEHSVQAVPSPVSGPELHVD